MTLRAAAFSLVVSSALVLVPAVLGAQAKNTSDTSVENQIELLRTDVRSQRQQIVSKHMALSDSQAAVFWPLYRQYETEKGKLMDQRIALIRDYAKVYDSMTDDRARQLANRAFDLEAQQVTLARTWYGNFLKKMPAKTATKFFQLDRFLDHVIDVKIGGSLPAVY